MLSTPQNQSISDDELMTLVQKQTFQYFWEGAEPISGAARERIHLDDVYPDNDKNVVTSGGTGFGVMAILVGIERKFITRKEGYAHLHKLVNWLEKADRFHGVWAHWMYGETGKVKPFSKFDDGADLVETAYLAQGLLCVRQYFQHGNKEEKALAQKMDKLWREIEWNWHQNGKNTLFWHWSPNHEWKMNFSIEGYNECLITYILGAASPTYPMNPKAYHEGWMANGARKNDPQHQQYGYHLALKHNGNEQYGGRLFGAHYSYLGLDPRHLKDKYADYWKENVNHTLINRQWCIENPKKCKGYGENCWGLTASYSTKFYAGHAPFTEDYGVITPTAALSSIVYTPEESKKVIRHLYLDMKDKIWGKYGFYDAFSESDNWYSPRYLAIDQGPIVVMIENHRSELLWKLFMSCPEIQNGLNKLGFTY